MNSDDPGFIMDGGPHVVEAVPANSARKYHDDRHVADWRGYRNMSRSIRNEI
jgi:hypothetical protein